MTTSSLSSADSKIMLLQDNGHHPVTMRYHLGYHYSLGMWNAVPQGLASPQPKGQQIAIY